VEKVFQGPKPAGKRARRQDCRPHMTQAHITSGSHDFRLLSYHVIRGYCLLATAVLFGEDSARVRWITNGDTSNGIFSRADSSEIGRFCISVI